MTQRQEALAAGINRAPSDSRSPDIGKFTLQGLWPGDPSLLENILRRWEQEGLLSIHKLPSQALGAEMCVEMKRYIGRSSPIPGFLEDK